MAIDNPIEDMVSKWPLWRDTGIPFSEAVNGPASPEEELRDDGSRAIRTFFCRWHERTALAPVILGSVYVASEGENKKYISRSIPDHHPDYTNEDAKPYLFATQIMRIEPWGFPDPENGRRKMRNVGKNISQYGLAKLQVLYETLPWEVLADDKIQVDDLGLPDEAKLQRHVVILPTPAAQGITIPTQAMKWVDGESPANAVTTYTSKLEITTDIIIKWTRVPKKAIGMKSLGITHPSYPIDNCIGKINATSFMSFSPGTLLMEAAIPTPVRSSIGARLYDIEFRLKLFNPTDANALPAGQPVTHTHLLRKLPADTEAKYIEATFKNDGPPVTTNLVNQGDGLSLYNFADFNFCFRVPR